MNCHSEDSARRDLSYDPDSIVGNGRIFNNSSLNITLKGVSRF